MSKGIFKVLKMAAIQSVFVLNRIGSLRDSIINLFRMQEIHFLFIKILREDKVFWFLDCFFLLVDVWLFKDPFIWRPIYRLGEITRLSDTSSTLIHIWIYKKCDRSRKAYFQNKEATWRLNYIAIRINPHTK